MAEPDPSSIAAAIEAQRGLARSLFDTLFEKTRDTEGVTRAAWSPEEELGLGLVAETGASLGLEVDRDELGQVFVTLPGQDRAAPRLLIGSHLDTVLRGGNYDGYAGVVAGMTALAAIKELGREPERDITVAGLRGEESVWYGIAFVGSRYAAGDLPHAELEQLRRLDTGKTLLEHLAECGHDAEAVKRATGARITAGNTLAYLELHIEQAPELERRDKAVAIPTVIRGNVRYPKVRCVGRYAHAAAEPIPDRRDAVLASAEIIHEFDRYWREQVKAGVPDTQLTVGRLHTDPEREGMTVVPGECWFSFNFGGTTDDFLRDGRERFEALAARIAERRQVRFELGDTAGSAPVVLDEGLRARLKAAADVQGIAYHEMATASHDAAVFARAGVPAAMILVRNQNGSHNPHEAMELDDFLIASQVLTRTAIGLSGAE